MKGELIHLCFYIVYLVVYLVLRQRSSLKSSTKSECVKILKLEQFSATPIDHGRRFCCANGGRGQLVFIVRAALALVDTGELQCN